MPESPKHPLYDLQVEQALIGAFLLDPKRVAIARSLVEPLDFFDEMHQLIVQLIYDFDEEGKAITPLTLNAWIKHNPAAEKLDKLYGENLPAHSRAGIYLATCAQSTPSMPNVAAYGTLIADFALRRRAIWAMGEAADAISARELSTPQPIGPALAPVVQLADEIAEKLQNHDVPTKAWQRGEVALQAIQNQATTGEVFGMRTNLQPLDDMIGGLYPENLIVIGGRPGMGKSILACNLLIAAARQGWAADYWSIEMPAREVVARLAADLSYEDCIRDRVDPLEYQDLVKMQVTGAQLHRAAETNLLLRDLDIDIFDQDRVTMRDIVSVSRARKSRVPAKKRLTVVDHLHIVTPDDRYRGRRVDELSEMTKAAKQLAKRTEGPVVLLCQLSRDLERRDDKRPYMSDFRDSGSIEQDADVVMTVYRHAYYAQRVVRESKDKALREEAKIEFERTSDKVEIEVHKQRSGRTAAVECFVDVKSSVMRSSSPWKARMQPQDGLAFEYGEPIDQIAK